MMSFRGWRSRQRIGEPRSLITFALVYGALMSFGCTLENSVKDDPDGEVALAALDLAIGVARNLAIHASK